MEKFDKNLTILNVKYKELNGVCNFLKFKHLIKLDCSHNNIVEMIELSSYINFIECNNNYIATLDNLPKKLKHLYCSYNELTNLDKLPSELKILDCSYNHIINLDNLPPKLTKLSCSSNKLVKLDNLPLSLVELICNWSDELLGLNYLPETLKILNVRECDKLILHDNNLPSGLDWIIYTLSTCVNYNKNVWLKKCVNNDITLVKKQNMCSQSFDPTEYNSNLDLDLDLDSNIM